MSMELDKTIPATLDQYLAWLDGYVKRGAIPTHFYNYPFSGFTFALSNIMVNSDTEYGANSRSIVVSAGLRVACTRPGGRFDGWGHSSLFLMDGFTVVGSDWIPVYSNPEFDSVLNEACQEERVRQKALSAQFRDRRRRY
jgi:hypothetical protein